MARPPHEPPPMLTRASITFHTNDDDKDDDSQIILEVMLPGRKAVVAQLVGCVGHFSDHSDSGPYNLVLLRSVSRDDLKNGLIDFQIVPNGNDTWRFNFLLDLYFSDGGHLFAKGTGVELSYAARIVVGLE